MYRQDPPKIDLSKFWDVKPEYPFEEEIPSPVPSPPANRIVEGVNKGIIDSETLDRYRTEDEQMKTEEYQKYLNPQEKKPFDFFNFGLKMRGASAGLSWLSGIKERNRQNQYLQQQLSTLGQNVARPAEQPNAYNLYAKYGGKLRNYDGRFSNKAKMRMDKGTPQHSGVFQTHPQAIGRYAKGGITPNKAREILHDGTAQGKKLTDKQRRFFGAMSKGHTNFRGRGK